MPRMSLVTLIYTLSSLDILLYNVGAPLGTDQCITEFIQRKVDTWKSIVLSLSESASSQPHVAYSAFTRGISHLWEFLCWTTPIMAHLLEPLEDTICVKFIPALAGHDHRSPIKCWLLSLPTRLGGLNIILPPFLSREYDASLSITVPLTSLVFDHSSQYSVDVLVYQGEKVKLDVHQHKWFFSKSA